jgi:tight adherence protein B
MNDLFFWSCNLVMGACALGAVLTGQSSYHLLVDRIEADLALRLRSLRMSNQRLRLRINMWFGILAGTFLAVWIGMDSIVFAVLAAVIMAAGPWYVVNRVARARKQKIEDQMADALVMFSSAVRAGLSLSQALELLGNECPSPIRQEFLQIIGEYKLGKPIERTLTEAKARLRSENFILFAAALLASRESGGRLNETVERISRSVLEMQRLERKVVSETAQARKSAVYMAIVPFFILVAYMFIDPENVQNLFKTLPGQIMLAMAVVLNLGAYFWALKILNPDI